MTEPISRRLFLAATAGALLAPRITVSADQVPTLLDHILLGCNDLDRGITFVETHTGVRATFGGVHPGRGTRNALLALGGRRYLEIIAPDPQQIGLARFPELKTMSEPRLLTWAAHPSSMDALAKHLRDAGVAFVGPSDGSRSRPDGKTLHWQTLDLKDDRHGLLPFFIQWSPDSTHPSVDAPQGCRLVSFGILTPDPQELANALRLLELDTPVERSDKAQLRAHIAGPKGRLDVTS
jgi:glyoxalase-like protein